jgi:hypothetical protein
MGIGIRSSGVFVNKIEKKAMHPTITAAVTKGRMMPRENFRTLFTCLKPK